MKQIQRVWAVLLIAGLLVLPGLLAAQPGGDDDVLDNPVPFDGGVCILVAVALVYGIIKVCKKTRVEPL